MPRILIGLLVSLLAPLGASALPVVSVDTDTSLEGIQDTRVVAVSESCTVDILIEGVTAGEPLNAFELSLEFDSTVLSATSATLGSFLLPTVMEPPTNNVTAPTVDFAAFTVGTVGASGSGILLNITFEVVGAGESVLRFTSLILSEPFGEELSFGDVFNACVTTDESGCLPPDPGLVPEPGVGRLLLLGLAGLVLRRAR